MKERSVMGKRRIVRSGRYKQTGQQWLSFSPWSQVGELANVTSGHCYYGQCIYIYVYKQTAGWENPMTLPWGRKLSAEAGQASLTICNVTGGGTAVELWHIYACYVDVVLGHWPVICMLGGSLTATAILLNIQNTPLWKQLPGKLTALCCFHLSHTSNHCSWDVSHAFNTCTLRETEIGFGPKDVISICF